MKKLVRVALGCGLSLGSAAAAAAAAEEEGAPLPEEAKPMSAHIAAAGSLRVSFEAAQHPGYTLQAATYTLDGEPFAEVPDPQLQFGRTHHTLDVLDAGAHQLRTQLTYLARKRSLLQEEQPLSITVEARIPFEVIPGAQVRIVQRPELDELTDAPESQLLLDSQIQTVQMEVPSAPVVGHAPSSPTSAPLPLDEGWLLQTEDTVSLLMLQPGWVEMAFNAPLPVETMDELEPLMPVHGLRPALASRDLNAKPPRAQLIASVDLSTVMDQGQGIVPEPASVVIEEPTVVVGRVPRAAHSIPRGMAFPVFFGSLLIATMTVRRFGRRGVLEEQAHGVF